MLSVERREAILDCLKQSHAATVADLSKRFSMSETSIRRDLEKLERVGYIRRTYGGAVIIEGNNDVLSLDARRQTEREAKSVIARKASDLIQNGDVIFLDSSSTALALAPHLERFISLSIITNGVKTAAALAEYPHLRTYCVGGFVAPNVFSCNGSIACQMLSSMYADKAFISPKAVDPHMGVYCANEEETAVRRAMMTRSKRTILLCDAKKLRRSASFRLCALEEIKTVVSDQALESETLERFTALGIRVL